MSPFQCVCALLIVLPFVYGYPAKTITPDPEETGGHFEGDMILDNDQLNGILARNGLITRAKRWPDRLVIYRISSDFDSAHRAQILKAIKVIEAATCLRFQEADAKSTIYINIIAEAEGCASTVGYQHDIQRMNLQIFPVNEGCFRLGSILHEFMHALGFYHQQSASDRDDYITLVPENIKEDMLYNFFKQSNTENFGIPYDYKSVMHYSAYAFSINGEKTIITRDPTAVIGQRTGLSTKDINKLNAMYLCPIQI